MRVLVTGAPGFTGSPLCEALIEGGHSVVGVEVAKAEHHMGYVPTTTPDGGLRSLARWCAERRQPDTAPGR